MAVNFRRALFHTVNLYKLPSYLVLCPVQKLVSRHLRGRINRPPIVTGTFHNLKIGHDLLWYEFNKYNYCTDKAFIIETTFIL